jgi:hypothetical protein
MADERSRSAASRRENWRHVSAGNVAARTRSSERGKKVFALLGVMLALAGAIVGFLFFYHHFQSPTFLSLPITEYNDHRFPANAFAQQDAEALLARFSGEGSGVAFNSQEGDLLRQKLEELRKRKDDCIVVHVNSLAVCRDGKVHLLPADANADRPETWLPLDTLLQAVRACPASRKLLILDLMKSSADPRLGILQNDVAKLVEQTVKSMPECPFWVLCACSGGQVSLVSEDLRRTVFGYFLEQGLRGKADHFGPTGKANGRIRVRELADYVTAQVDRWAIANRDTRQTPVLLGSGKDFELSLVEQSGDIPLDELDDAYPAPLAEGWKVRDGWLQDGGLRDARGVIRNWETSLLWAEQHWRGGLEFDRVRDNPRMKLFGYEQPMKAARPGEAPRSRSLALAVVAAKQEPDDKTIDDLKDLVRDSEEAAKATDPAAAKTALTVNVDIFRKKFEKTPLTLAEAAFRVALDDPRASKVRFLADVARVNQALPLYGETLLLRRLAALDLKRWPEDGATRSIRSLFRAVKLSEKALACDPEVVPWIAEGLGAAMSKQVEGELRLFSGEPDKIEEASRLLDEAERGYATVARRSDAFVEAFRILRDALVFLPGDALFLMNSATPSEQDQQVWADAVTACRSLHELLAAPPNAGAPLASAPRKNDGDVDSALAQYTRTLTDRVDILNKPFTKKNLDALVQQSLKADATPTTLLALENLTQSPLLKRDDRITAWKAGLAMSRRLHERWMTDPQGQTAPVLSDVDRRRLETVEHDRAKSRALSGIGLLRLAGLESAAELELARKNLPANAEDPAWEALGDKLRLGWSTQLPVRWRDQMAKENWAEAACIAVVAPSQKPGEMLGDTSAKAYRRQAKNAWTWIGNRYRENARSFPDGSVEAAFFRRAADEFLQANP